MYTLGRRGLVGASNSAAGKTAQGLQGRKEALAYSSSPEVTPNKLIS